MRARTGKRCEQGTHELAQRLLSASLAKRAGRAVRKLPGRGLGGVRMCETFPLRSRKGLPQAEGGTGR